MEGLQRTRGSAAVSFHVHPSDQRSKGAHAMASRLSGPLRPHRRQGKVGADLGGAAKRHNQALRGSRGAPPGERVTFLRSEAEQKLT